jgi:hypothetical protein
MATDASRTPAGTQPRPIHHLPVADAGPRVGIVDLAGAGRSLLARDAEVPA